MALLKILAIGDKEIEAGKTYPIQDAIDAIRKSRPGQSGPSRLPDHATHASSNGK
jgi:hypothetical protein